MLECASQSNPRGILSGWDDEDVSAGLGMPVDQVVAIRHAMAGKTLEGNELSGWKRRQPKAEDLGAAARKRDQRQRERASAGGVTSSDDGGCHAMSRNVTTEEKRGEERRREEKRREEKERTRQRAPSKTSLPETFGISERVQAWAAEKGYTQLDQHLESFRAKAQAKGYTYADWDAAFMEAIRENWAKLPPAGENVIPMHERPGGGRRAL